MLTSTIKSSSSNENFKQFQLTSYDSKLLFIKNLNICGWATSSSLTRSRNATFSKNHNNETRAVPRTKCIISTSTERSIIIIKKQLEKFLHRQLHFFLFFFFIQFRNVVLCNRLQELSVFFASFAFIATFFFFVISIIISKLSAAASKSFSSCLFNLKFFSLFLHSCFCSQCSFFYSKKHGG